MKSITDNYELKGSLLPILTYPHPTLTTVASEVTKFDSHLKDFCLDMLYTMYQAPGIGLAAPQVGRSERIFVLDVDYTRDETSEDSGEYVLDNFAPKIFINPKIIDQDGEKIYQEGC